MNSTPSLPLLVFSDLDGTLIDHQTYSAAAADPALKALKSCDAGLVMASSKTGPEISRIRDALGWSDWPAIIENGAGVLPPKDAGLKDSAQYDQLRDHLNTVPQHLRSLFRGFGDMDAADVAKTTGLPVDAARLAKTRAFSEPGLWDGTVAQRAAFLDHLAGQGVTCREGGRFLTLSFGQTKADRMTEMIDQYRPDHTIALGDAPNDIEMLETADIGVIIANPHRAPLPPLKGETDGRITRTRLAGPQGWNQSILALLDTLQLT